MRRGCLVLEAVNMYTVYLEAIVEMKMTRDGYASFQALC